MPIMQIETGLSVREQVALQLYAAFMSSTLTLEYNTPETWAFERADVFLAQVEKERKASAVKP